MPKVKNLFFILLFSIVFSGFVVAQAPQSLVPTQIATIKETFISLDGGFTIALPQMINGMNSIKPTEGISRGGTQFIWRTPQAMFAASVTELIDAPSDIKQAKQNIVDNFTRLQEEKNNARLIDKKDIFTDGISGTEVRLHSGEDLETIVRFYIVDKRIYGLSAFYKGANNETQLLQILDSFKLIDKKTAIAKKLEEVSPTALPQSPVIKKTTSDIEDERLKGKVKLVSESREYPSETSNFSGVKLSSEYYYDEKGNQTKHLFYDYRSNPSSITIYGFIDGMRVSSSGWLHYDYNPPPPPPPAMMPSKEKPKPADSRYETKYEFTYDEKKRLKETLTFNNRGDLNGKTIYIYDRNKVEKTSYASNGTVNSKTIEIFDEKGNLTENIRVGNENYPDSKYTYSYESFDKKGNWTKRGVTGKTGQYGGGYKDANYVEYRTITYYQ